MRVPALDRKIPWLSEVRLHLQLWKEGILDIYKCEEKGILIIGKSGYTTSCGGRVPWIPTDRKRKVPWITKAVRSKKYWLSQKSGYTQSYVPVGNGFPSVCGNPAPLWEGAITAGFLTTLLRYIQWRYPLLLCSTSLREFHRRFVHHFSVALHKVFPSRVVHFFWILDQIVTSLLHWWGNPEGM